MSEYVKPAIQVLIVFLFGLDAIMRLNTNAVLKDETLRGRQAGLFAWLVVESIIFSLALRSGALSTFGGWQ